MAEGKDQFVIIGDSGAGKSVFINYIAGAKMKKEHDPESSLQIINIDEKGKRGKGTVYSPIGHKDKSMTFIPVVIGGI